MPTSALRATRVWDLPTRLFHWALALAVTGSLVSGKIGGDAMTWHFRSGYAIAALLLFRLAWGLVGGRWSRFSSFIYAPTTVLRYLRGKTKAGEHLDIGHNPLGSLSVFALLAVLLVQVASGSVADDEIILVGPLNRFVSTDLALQATSWHNRYGQWLVFGLVGLHLAAITWYLLKKRSNLIGPMVGGDKQLPPGTPASADRLPQRIAALLLALAAALLVTWAVRLGLQV
ncbi:MAG: cytochrome b/b6 domain-containing protein [Rubrivivax sp.]